MNHDGSYVVQLPCALADRAHGKDSRVMAKHGRAMCFVFLNAWTARGLRVL